MNPKEYSVLLVFFYGPDVRLNRASKELIVIVFSANFHAESSFNFGLFYPSQVWAV